MVSTSIFHTICDSQLRSPSQSPPFQANPKKQCQHVSKPHPMHLVSSNQSQTTKQSGQRVSLLEYWYAPVEKCWTPLARQINLEFPTRKPVKITGRKKS